MALCGVGVIALPTVHVFDAGEYISYNSNESRLQRGTCLTTANKKKY